MKFFLLFVMWWTIAAVIAGPFVGMWIRRRAHARNFGVRGLPRGARPDPWLVHSIAEIRRMLADSREKREAPFGYSCPKPMCNVVRRCPRRLECAARATRNYEAN